MIQIAYTNKNCSDVLIPFVKQNKKNTTLPLYLISDYDVNDLNVDGVFKYSNEEDYYKVWCDAIDYFSCDNFIYLQEDFYLYDKVDSFKLEELKNYLNSSEYSFIRLIKSGKLNNKEISKNIFEIESDNVDIFSMQATIWKSEDYKKIMNIVKSKNWLENSLYREKIMELGFKGLYYHDNERKIGKNHWDSKIYPYIATAVVRGKWNFKEYKKELEPILVENNLNPNIRGIF